MRNLALRGVVIFYATYLISFNLVTSFGRLLGRAQMLQTKREGVCKDRSMLFSWPKFLVVYERVCWNRTGRTGVVRVVGGT